MRLMVLLLVCVSFVGASDVFQYGIEERSAPTKRRPNGVVKGIYLWLPPKLETVRGIIIGGRILMEPDFVQDEAIRAACAEAGLGIVYCSPHIDAVLNEADTNGPRFEQAVQKLAEKSGHPELATAPWLPIGHSVSTHFSSNLLHWKPERAFGAIMFKGDFKVPDDRLSAVSGIPMLVIKGEFEEFGPGPNGVLRDNEDRSSSAKITWAECLERRQKHPGLCLGMAVESGSTHMAWTGRLSAACAAFIKGAAKLRLPKEAGGALQNVAIDQGHLLAADIKAGDRLKAASGMAADAAKGYFWFPDVATATAVDAIHEDIRSKKPQFVTFADANKGNPIGVRHDMRMDYSPKWVGPDEIQVKGVFMKNLPKKYPAVDGTISHAKGDILFRAYGGGLKQVAPDRFKVIYSRRAAGPEIVVYHPGDDTYRYAEQPARIRIGRVKKGKEQTISFSAPEAITASKLPLSLKASSSAKLPVGLTVAYGPAIIVDGKLSLADVPAKAGKELEIKVVAYQQGSQQQKVMAAKPVEQVIRISR